jgi:hypothetical protein
MASEEARKNDAEAQRDRTINVPDASQLNDKLDDDLPSGSERDEASRLRSLAADVRDQDEIERNVARQACPHACRREVYILTLPWRKGRQTPNRAGE